MRLTHQTTLLLAIAVLLSMLCACVGVEPPYREVRLPPSRALSPAEQPIYVRILFNGDIYVSDVKSSRERLIDDIVAAAKISAPEGDPHDQRIYVRPERGVPYQQFTAILQLMKQYGFYSIALVGDVDA